MRHGNAGKQAQIFVEKQGIRGRRSRGGIDGYRREMLDRPNAATREQYIPVTFRKSYVVLEGEHRDEAISEVVAVGHLLLSPPEIFVTTAVFIVAAAAPIERGGIDHVSIRVL